MIHLARQHFGNGLGNFEKCSPSRENNGRLESHLVHTCTCIYVGIYVGECIYDENASFRDALEMEFQVETGFRNSVDSVWLQFGLSPRLTKTELDISSR